MRIVQVIDNLGSGGAERLLAIYAIELHRTGHDVHVVALGEKNGNPEVKVLREAGIPTTLFPIGKLRNFRRAAGYFSLLGELEPDVVHAHLEFSSVLSSIYCRRNDVPLLSTVHTLFPPRFSNRDGIRRWLMCKLLERYCDRVICLSSAAEDYARKNGLARARTEVLPNGIDTEEFSPRSAIHRDAIRRTFEIPANAFLVLTVAVLRQPKGIDRLIRAIAAIENSNEDTRLLVVGDGPEMERLVTLAAELDLSERVIFAGRRTDVSDVMAAADLFVLPTLDDAQPTVIMEAMASGLPVIASRVGGIPDMIEHGKNGLLVPPDDVPALSEAISGLRSDAPLRQKLADAGRAIVLEKFSLERQVERLSGLYRSLVN